jgi:hypothetical protein
MENRHEFLNLSDDPDRLKYYIFAIACSKT